MEMVLTHTTSTTMDLQIHLEYKLTLNFLNDLIKKLKQKRQKMRNIMASDFSTFFFLCCRNRYRRMTMKIWRSGSAKMEIVRTRPHGGRLDTDQI